LISGDAIIRERQNLEQDYAYCRQRTASHYENFPVGSWLLPKKLRDPIAAIYCFARTADDFADEGVVEPQVRLDNLGGMEKILDNIKQGEYPSEPLYAALADTIHSYSLPIQLFKDLLTAFRQDITKQRYANFEELMNYCRYSANPVGRLLLHLFKAQEPADLECSDLICSALQLTNFLQDLHQDYTETGRIYIPLDELQRFGVTEDDIAHRISNQAMGLLMEYQIKRATAMLSAGAPLCKRLRGRAGLELRLIVLGGLRVLRRLKNQQQNNLFSRPRLTTTDWMWMCRNAATGTFPT